jgi:hypothetical protein
MIAVWDRSDPARSSTAWWGHIGVVSQVAASGFHSVEGNSGDRVAENEHALSDSKLLGAGWVD